MIITVTEFLGHVRIDLQTLEFWIEEQWLVPAQSEGAPAFSEVDLARAQLIRDLTEDLGVNAEGVGIVLQLVDQMHGLRSALGKVLKDATNRPA
jgi:chaperone modulatory protein CbpM